MDYSPKLPSEEENVAAPKMAKFKRENGYQPGWGSPMFGPTLIFQTRVWSAISRNPLVWKNILHNQQIDQCWRGSSTLCWPILLIKSTSPPQLDGSIANMTRNL